MARRVDGGLGYPIIQRYRTAVCVSRIAARLCACGVWCLDGTTRRSSRAGGAILYASSRLYTRRTQLTVFAAVYVAFVLVKNQKSLSRVTSRRPTHK